MGGNLARRLQLARGRAVGLAREHALDELGGVKQAEQAGEQGRASRARRRASCLLPVLSGAPWRRGGDGGQGRRASRGAVCDGGRPPDSLAA
eukprot:2505214-Pyramimonas_sp.AAC.1